MSSIKYSKGKIGHPIDNPKRKTSGVKLILDEIKNSEIPGKRPPRIRSFFPDKEKRGNP